MREKVLITGGCGFIGSHIADKLIAEGYDVAVVDNLATGKKCNIDSANVRFYECSILEPVFEEIVVKEQPEYIIHQAAQVSVFNSIQDSLYDEEVNIRGSLKVIEAAVKAHTKKVIYASSAAVYGVPQYLPIDTKHPISPLSPYGVSKFSVEKYLEMSWSLHGLDYTILRYANVFGPRQDALGEGGVISIFMDSIVKGQQITIFGDGEQTRDFIYVEDVADANVQALKLGSRDVHNISTGSEISLNELTGTIMEITGTSQSPQYENEREGDIKRSVLCNEKSKKDLYWEPKYTLRDGLHETFRYYSSSNKR
ncbi:NAD-dependent epimerase/dehydratase family protein [Bacillus sp. 7894-2]|uniref:NAD-dependent epimerase/dehydratase family protein n=1 Tax=Bacillus sp. 7894-2 TaxID=2021695 RepID=UPI000BA79913|nr:NAD-dependent epimerase/dehydratase family protein [Bacillus sp. 7894-2]PAE25861.1 UDP-glucose 4-epimerase [Bacillus sp. 7894-2]